MSIFMYGKNKERSMIRSVLPSTSRKAARINLAMIKRKNRRNISQSLHAVAIDPEIWDARTGYDYYPYEGVQGSYSAHTSIREAVSERRSHDNLGAFLQWAPSQVAHLRPLDRMSYLTAKLPHNTIGRHAASHVEYLDEFYVSHDHERRYYNGQVDKETLAFKRAVWYAGVVARLAVILEDSRKHRRLNAILKKPVIKQERIRGTDGKYSYVRLPDEKGRPLYGAHDIDACIAYYAGRPDLTDKFSAALKKVEE